MGACASKPKVRADDAIPAPVPVDDIFVKKTEEVKVVEEEKKVHQNNEKKKEDIEKVVVEDEIKPDSLASLTSLFIEKEATSVMEDSSVPKVEEKPKAEEKPQAEPPKEALVAPAPAPTEEMKKIEEKALTNKEDENSI